MVGLSIQMQAKDMLIIVDKKRQKLCIQVNVNNGRKNKEENI